MFVFFLADFCCCLFCFVYSGGAKGGGGGVEGGVRPPRSASLQGQQFRFQMYFYYTNRGAHLHVYLVPDSNTPCSFAVCLCFVVCFCFVFVAFIFQVDLSEITQTEHIFFKLMCVCVSVRVSEYVGCIYNIFTIFLLISCMATK